MTVVDAWSAGLKTSWSAAEKSDVADRVVELAEILEPHLVEDEAITNERKQAYWLGRTLSHVEDWLLRSAAGPRRALRLGSTRLRPGSGAPALGLRSASLDELEALPGIGEALAKEIQRFLAAHPEVTDMDALLQIHGVGPDRLEQLKETSYLDEPAVAWVSPSVWAFAMRPSVPTALAMLEQSDVGLGFGDMSALARRLPAAGASVAARFSGFLDVVGERARGSASGAAGSLASDANRWLDRRATRERVLGDAVDANGAILASGDYVASAKAAIEGSSSSIELMVFLGTLTDADDGLAPLPLVESLEAAAARGVDVRVVLDQDEESDPYGSSLINQPLVDRLKAAGIAVKLDTKERLLHSKVLVVDRSTCFVGSHNWTRAGFTKTHELSVRVEAAGVAASFGVRFDALWSSLPDLP